MPVLIDEAYHHFVDDPDYATSIPYVTQDRQVIVTRTFSKIAALAGVRLGYAIAPKRLCDQLRPLTDGSVSALAKHAGVAARKDTENEARVRSVTLDLRRKTIAALTALGYAVIPSQANFFMVHVRTDVTPVIAEFRKKGVMVGRRFPPMVEHLRVSVGTEAEMSRFLAAFKEIFAGQKTGASGGI